MRFSLGLAFALLLACNNTYCVSFPDLNSQIISKCLNNKVEYHVGY